MSNKYYNIILDIKYSVRGVLYVVTYCV